MFDWPTERAAKRGRSLLVLGDLPVIPFTRAHATRAAQLEAEMKLNKIGTIDFQIAATALEDEAELLTFNQNHFSRVPGLALSAIPEL